VHARPAVQLHPSNLFRTSCSSRTRTIRRLLVLLVVRLLSRPRPLDPRDQISRRQLVRPRHRLAYAHHARQSVVRVVLRIRVPLDILSPAADHVYPIIVQEFFRQPERRSILNDLRDALAARHLSAPLSVAHHRRSFIFSAVLVPTHAHIQPISLLQLPSEEFFVSDVTQVKHAVAVHVLHRPQ